MNHETTGDVHKIRFDSLSELAAEAKSRRELLDRNDPDFTGVASHNEAFRLARDGWGAKLDETMDVAESAVSKVERDVTMDSFVAEFGVAGCEVDVARFLDGTPENMIDYPLREIVKAGKVITLCASVSYSGAVEAETIMKRGQAIAALALALSRLGYSIEIWADITTQGAGKRVQVRTLIKDAQDALDAERIAYSVAHPSMLRVLNFAALRMAPREFVDAIGYSALGRPTNPIEDLPDGTLYLPCVLSSYDVPDADTQLIRWLKQLEIIPDDAD